MSIKRSIPNTITLLNLLSGTVALLSIFEGRYTLAVGFILLGALFDFFDGFVARLLNVKSALGKELDSLADLVTFGVAPALLLLFHYREVLSHLNPIYYSSIPLKLLSYTPLVVVAASALRLAKFNTDDRQHKSFIGLPTPANAITISATLLTLSSTPALQFCYTNYWFYPLLSLLSAWLLISPIEMFSLKIERGDSLAKKRLRIFALLLLVVVVATLMVSREVPILVMNGMLLYIVLNSILYLVNRVKK